MVRRSRSTEEALDHGTCSQTKRNMDESQPRRTAILYSGLPLIYRIGITSAKCYVSARSIETRGSRNVILVDGLSYYLPVVGYLERAWALDTSAHTWITC